MVSLSMPATATAAAGPNVAVEVEEEEDDDDEEDDDVGTGTMAMGTGRGGSMASAATFTARVSSTAPSVAWLALSGAAAGAGAAAAVATTRIFFIATTTGLGAGNGRSCSPCWFLLGVAPFFTEMGRFSASLDGASRSRGSTTMLSGACLADFIGDDSAAFVLSGVRRNLLFVANGFSLLFNAPSLTTSTASAGPRTCSLAKGVEEKGRYSR